MIGSRTTLRTFFTNESTTVLRMISSASPQRPRTSYVRRHSSTSAVDFVLSVSNLSGVANTLSRSENSVDFTRCIRWELAIQWQDSVDYFATVPIVSQLRMHVCQGSPSRRDRVVGCIQRQLVRGALHDSRERARRVGLRPALVQ
jgi:hypothetical protein